MFNIHPSKCEQANVVECLVDLDNYLEKMDEDSIKDARSELNLYRSPVVTPSCIPSSIRRKNFSETNSQLGRTSKLRNTMDCTFNTRKKVSQNEAVSIYGTWNKKENRSTPIPNTLGTYFIPDKENPKCSTHISKSEIAKYMNTTRVELESECASNNGFQFLTNDQILQNLIEQHQNIENIRPRQFGRRADHISSLLNNTTPRFRNINDDNRISNSAPVSNSIPEINCHNDILYAESNESTTRTSGNSTPISTESSTISCESLPVSDNIVEENINVNNENDQQNSQSTDLENMNLSVNTGFNTYWPHSCSRTLALISCTLGLFNINRFAVLTVNYGGNFLIQFFILSIIFGIPFLWLQMSLGSKIIAGPIAMWKISPICIGVGISITLVQYFVAIYSSVAVAWVFMFIQDILINKPSYPWSGSRSPIYKQESNLTESIPNYFNADVLQRIHLLKIIDETGVHFQTKFITNYNLAFYLVLLWAVVFLILCKGLKSFGNCLLLLGILPIVFLAAVAVKLLCVVDFLKLQNIFSSSKFYDFLINSNSWAAAAQETYLTWSLYGASVIVISSRSHRKPSKLVLRKDAILTAVITLIGLCLSSLVGLCSIQILNESGYIYVPGSYETSKHYSAVFSLKSLASRDGISYPTKFLPHYSTLVGEVYRHNTDISQVSGYQALRFITELLPAALAISTERISWIWTLMIYIAFMLFGLSQLCVMWKPIACTLGYTLSTALMSCVTAVLLSMPFTTEFGISLLYYMEIVLGGAWFLPVLWSAEILGVFLIRGRPYNADDLVNDLKMCRFISAFLALSWNIFLPIGLIILAIIEYKISMSSQFYCWRGKSYFNYWSRKTAALTQIGFLVLIPISAIVQIYRYLTSGPPDILDRLQMLYRPLDDVDGNQINNSMSFAYYENNSNSAIERIQHDAPPKYTPPPSYTTATGARLARILRQSLRRSIRHLLGESERPRPIPPEHSCYPTEGLRTKDTSISISETIELENRPFNLIYGRSLSLGRNEILNKRRFKVTNELSNDYDSNSNRRSLRRLYKLPYTAEHVITVLRSSKIGRRVVSRSVHQQTAQDCSIENLIQNAQSLDISSAVVDKYSNLNDEN